MHRISCLSLILLATPSAASEPTRFERAVIDDDFPGGYQVEVADVDGDGKPDLVALGGKTLAWYQNPTWKKRVIASGALPSDIISSATADLDGDGKAEVAVACDFSMNEPTRGKLMLAIQGTNLDDPWEFRPVADVPSIHRVRWGRSARIVRVSEKSVEYEPKLALVVAPLFGPSARPPIFDQAPAELAIFDTGPDPKLGRWKSTMIVDRAPVLHAIELVDFEPMKPGGGLSAVLMASNRGVTSARVGGAISGGAFLNEKADLAPGAEGQAPKKGASEIHAGRLKDGRKFLATVEPWHGTEVVVYVPPQSQPLETGPRLVIDPTFKEGHALWVADVDGDGDDEIFGGDRGSTPGISMYDFDGKAWTRTVIDTGVAAQDLRGGDLDGDGVPDVVAIGGKTHNLVWYRPIRPAK